MGCVLTRISISISIFYIDRLIYPGFGCLHCACRSLRDIHESYREHSRWLLMLSNRSYHGVFFLGVYGHPILNTKWGCWRMFWSLHSMQLQWLETEAFENPDHSDPWINHFTYSAKWSHLLWMNHSLDSDSLKICKSSSYRSEWFVHNWSASQVQLTDSKWLHFSLFLKKSWLQRAQIAWCIMWTTFMVICSEAWKHSVLFNEIALKSNESPWV